MRSERVRYIADVRVSNVDKKSVQGEVSVRLCNYTDVYYNERITADLDFMEATASPSQCLTFQLAPGDVLLTKDSETPDDIGVCAVVAETRPLLLCGYHLALIRPRPHLANGRYLRYALSSSPAKAEMTSRAMGITRYGLRSSAIGDLTIPVPALDTQRIISDYLDRETARIDSLIERKQRLVVLLDAQSKVDSAMTLFGTTSGPGYPRTELPHSWRLIPFRRLFREIDDRSDDGSEELLSVSQTRGVLRQSELGERRQHAETHAGYKRCRTGDLVINRMWVYYGALGVAPYAGIVSPDYSVFRSHGDLHSEFAALVLRTPAFVGEMTRLVRGVGVAFQGAVRKPRLHPRELGTIQMPVPPEVDQERLVVEITAQARRIERNRQLLMRSIQLLEEKRQAFITAAVSGQIDIPGAV